MGFRLEKCLCPRCCSLSLSLLVSWSLMGLCSCITVFCSVRMSNQWYYSHLHLMIVCMPTKPAVMYLSDCFSLGRAPAQKSGSSPLVDSIHAFSRPSLSLYSVYFYILPSVTMSASLRSLSPLARHALRTGPVGRVTLPLLVQRRGYKQPARDMMTGEVIQLPDIDVSHPRPSTSTSAMRLA